MANERPQTVRDGPWRRLRDQMNPNTRVKGALSRCRNMMPDPTGRLIWRPGQIATNSTALGGLTPGNPVQLLYNFVKKNGTRYTIGISSGKFFTYDWAGVWTEILTTAELTAAAVTLSTTARCSALTFADKVIISDGVNIAFAWDGTAHAGITKLTNAPVFAGPMTQYYGRIFARKASDPTTIVWSEVLQPNTGYEAGFANAWTVVQTDSSAITAIFGTEDGLYVFRAYSIIVLTGRPDTNFQSNATRESVEGIGTSSPWAIISTEKGIVFPDSDYRVHLLRAGGTPIPAWEDFAETISAFDSAGNAGTEVIAIDYSPAELILFAVRTIGVSAQLLETILVYDAKPDIPTPVAIWDSEEMAVNADPWLPSMFAMVQDNLGVPRLMHGTNTGYIYVHGNPREAGYNSNNSVGASPVYVPIIHELATQPLTFDEKKEWIYDRIDISFTEILEPCTVWISYETPRGRSRWKMIRLQAGGGRWNVDAFAAPPGFLTPARWGRPGGEIKKSIGIDGRGRWIKIHMMHKPPTLADGDEYDANYVGPYFGINQLAITCYEAGDDPGAP